MKSYSKLLSALIISTIFFFSCSNRDSFSPNNSASPAPLSLPDTSLAPGRVTIKTADISLEVKKVEESVLDFQELVNSMHGHVFHYEIQNEKHQKEEVQHTLDSSLVVSEVYPKGMIKVKVPVAYGDTFVSAVLKMDGSISNFLFDENDVTEDINEKKDLMLGDAGPANSKAGRTKTTGENYFEKETRESFAKHKANFAKMNYQASYLWFDITLKGNPYTSQQMIATASSVRTPFYVSAVEALRNGWYGFSIFLTLFLQLWPFLLVGGIIYFIIKKKLLKRMVSGVTLKGEH